ncbi:MAG: alpha/beta hydrolase [Opitutales bacterium]
MRLLRPQIRCARLLLASVLATLASLGSGNLKAGTGQETISLFELTSDPTTMPVVHTYKSTPEKDLRAYVYLPQDWQPSDARSAVIYVHGGGWTAGVPANHDSDANYFARRGLVAITIEYRLSALPEPTLFTTLSDVRSAIRWVRQEAASLGINPHRVAVVGESAGGHLAGCLALIDGFDDPADDLTVSALPDAVILLNPIMDIPDLPWLFFNNATKPFFPVSGSAPTVPPDPEDTSINGAWRLSPLYYIGEGHPPTLLMHGSKDPVVDSDQSVQSHQRLQANGNTAWFFLVEGAFHAFPLAFSGRESEVVCAMAAVDDFLGYLGFLSGSACIEPFSLNLLENPDFSNDAAWSLNNGAAIVNNGPQSRLQLGAGNAAATQTIRLLDFPFHPTGLDSERYLLRWSGTYEGGGAEAVLEQLDTDGLPLASETLPLASVASLTAFDETCLLLPGTRQVRLTLAKSNGGGPAYLDAMKLQVNTRGAPESYAAWQKLHFTPQEQVLADLSGPGAGAPPNLMKYALGLDRHEPTLARNFRQAFSDGALSMRFYRNAFQSDLSVLAEWTANPATPSWNVLYDSDASVPPNAAFERHRVQVNATDAAAAFLRLKVRSN